MQLLTAGLTRKELATLKKLMLRRGFVEEWNNLDVVAAAFAKSLLAKENATPSASYNLFTSFDPEAVLWLGFTSKNEAVKERFNLFLKVWPEVRQRIPHSLLQEMRITSELPGYNDIVQKVFLELLDGRLATPEEARAFLEPYSPPAPLIPVAVKRPRAKRGSEARLKEQSFEDEESEGGAEDEDGEDLDEIGGDDDELALELHLPKADMEIDLTEESESVSAEDEEEEKEDVNPKPASKPVPAKRAPKLSAQPKAAKASPRTAASPQKVEESAASQKVKAGGKPTPVRAKESVSLSKLALKPVAAKAPVKVAAKPSAKPAAKALAKAAAAKPLPARTKSVAFQDSKLVKAAKPSSSAIKKLASKPAKKH